MFFVQVYRREKRESLFWKIESRFWLISGVADVFVDFFKEKSYHKREIKPEVIHDVSPRFSDRFRSG